MIKCLKTKILCPPGHAAVDAKVDGVGEEDAGVDEHGHRVGQLVVYEVQVHAGFLTKVTLDMCQYTGCGMKEQLEMSNEPSKYER